MGDILGLDVGALSVPTFDITGFVSSTWMWVALVVVVGIVLVGAVATILFLITFNRKIVIFENVSGQGYQPILRTRARIIKMNIGEGGELMKTLFGNLFLTAYGRKMGKNTYWFAKGQDGFLYNVTLGDFDAKTGMLDIEPIERDVRGFQIILDRYSHQHYGKQSFMEKYGIHMMLFLFLIVLVLGMWFIIGKIGDVTEPLAQSNQLMVERDQLTNDILAKVDSLIRAMKSLPESSSSGLIPAPT